MEIDRLQRRDIDDVSNNMITLNIDEINTAESPYVHEDADSFSGNNWIHVEGAYVKYNLAEDDYLTFLYSPINVLSEKKLCKVIVSFDYSFTGSENLPILDNVSLVHDSIDHVITDLELDSTGHVDADCSLFNNSAEVLNDIICGQGFGIGLNFKGNNSNAFARIYNVKIIFGYDDGLQDEVDSVANRFIRGLCASVNDDGISDDRNIYNALTDVFFNLMDCVNTNFTDLPDTGGGSSTGNDDNGDGNVDISDYDVGFTYAFGVGGVEDSIIIRTNIFKKT